MLLMTRTNDATTTPGHPGRDQARESWSGWLAGLVLGALVGLTSISFVLGLLALPLLAVSIVLIAVKGPRLPASAGLLTGWGLLWTVVITQATISCLAFDRGPGRECAPGEPWPWLAAGAVMFVLGLVASAWALRRASRRRASGS